MKKLPKSIPDQVPIIPQKSSKIHIGTLKSPPARTHAPNADQTAAKVVAQEPQNAPKRVSQAASKSLDLHALINGAHGK